MIEISCWNLQKESQLFINSRYTLSSQFNKYFVVPKHIRHLHIFVCFKGTHTYFV